MIRSALPTAWGRLLHFFSFGLVLAAVSFVAAPSTTSGYALNGRSWVSGSAPVFQLHLGTAPRPLQDGNVSWDAAVLPVFAMWDEQIGSVKVASVLNPVAPLSSGDGVNTIAFSSTVFGQSFGSSTLAVTYYRTSGTSMTEADVLFNTAIAFDSYRGKLQFPAGGGFAIPDIRRVLLHELGHALGLNHPDAQHVDAVMNSVTSDRETLSADDIAGGQALYGAAAAQPAPTPAPTATPTPTPTATPASNGSHLANISTRMNVGVDNDVLIGGFIIKGTDSKRLILRALGPTLGAAGIATAMTDPTLELRDAAGGLVAFNDDWQVDSNVSEVVATGFAPPNDSEPAIVAVLPPGSYTAIVRGYNGEVGMALIEAYELGSTTTSKLANISTRGRVGLDDEALIGGIIVQGTASKSLILRARGPSMSTAAAPFPGVLLDPVLELHDAAGNLLDQNDNWQASTQASAISRTGFAPSNAAEAAIVTSLPPGSYTAIVRGAGNSTGIGLVEVFDLDP